MKNSNQSIKKWEKHYRDDKGVWELICEHGIGHEPDVHGCDGCCSDKSFKKEYQTIKKEGKCGIKHIHNYFDCCSACINGEHPSEGASGHVKTCKRYKSVPPQSVSKECNCLKVCGIFPPRVGGKLSCYTLRTNDCPIHCKPEQPKEWKERLNEMGGRMKKCKLCKDFYDKYPLITKNGEQYHEVETYLHYSPIECAFKNGVFTEDNWGCRTMSELRSLAYEKGYNERDDMANASIGVFPIPEDEAEQSGYVVMTWYKDRGKTGQAWVMCDDLEPELLTLKTAEAILEYMEKIGVSSNQHSSPKAVTVKGEKHD